MQMKQSAQKIKSIFLTHKHRSTFLVARQGFTLIEMMIVVAIIAFVMGLVGMNMMSKFKEAKFSTAKLQIKQLGLVLDDYKRVCGNYPTTEQGLDALIKAPVVGKLCKNYDPDGFLQGKKVISDPWHNDYIYESDGVKYVLKSQGDGKEVSSENLD